MLHAVIMAGGSGTRFWPRSRRQRPKQLIRIFGEGTMIQQTVTRLQPELPLESCLIITNRDQAQEMRRQLPQLRPDQIIAEPCGRDTSACIGLGAMLVRRRDPDGVMAVLAADHVIAPAEEFQRCLREAARLAREHRVLVTFGVRPTEPSELFGYIHRGEPFPARVDSLSAFRIAEFKEKPRRATAEEYVRAGTYYWNSGNFVWRADDILEAIRAHLPELYAGLERIERALDTPAQAEVLSKEYASLPRISIDYGVMEKAPNAVVVEASFDWDDVGSWNAVARHQSPDANGNCIQAKFAGIGAGNCVIVGEGEHLIAAVGVQNLIIVHTPDATLVCDRRRAADVKALVDLLKSMGLDAYL